MMGYFRDDMPLCELILDEPQKRELDGCGRSSISSPVPMRQHTGFIWFERAESATIRRWAEFDFPLRRQGHHLRSQDQAAGRALSGQGPESNAANGGDAVAIEALDDFFKSVNAKSAGSSRPTAGRRAEPSEIAPEIRRAGLPPAAVAGGARRPAGVLSSTARERWALTHEEAIRDTLVSVLMSPHFCYRIDLVDAGTKRPQPLSDYELASRLSYFLWSSMPDAELLAHAAAGDLHKPEVLLAQARRMLHDDRMRGLATEFGGNWLDFRRFEEHNSVDRERFPSFTTSCGRRCSRSRSASSSNWSQHDRSVLDFLYGDHTFVNPVLAKHYGMPDAEHACQTSGCASTTPTNTAAAGCCRWRSS